MTEVVAVQDLWQRYGDVEALRGVSFVLEGPQVVGLLGPNGAGKTTLLDILEGLAVPASGAVRLFGAPLDRARYPRSRVGTVLQKESSLDGILVGEYAELFGALYSVPRGRQRILGRAGLEERSRVPLARLSGGEAQRLYLAAATVHEPELLLLDEPTAHLDPGHRREVGELIRERGRASTVILSTHDLREAEALCHYVLFLVDGQLKAQGTMETFLESGKTLEEAFFQHCSVRITRRGDQE